MRHNKKLVVAVDLLEEAEEAGHLAMMEVEVAVKLNGWTARSRAIYLAVGAALQVTGKAKRLVQEMGVD